MSLPIAGTWRVRVLQCHPFSIHEDRYWELWVVRREEKAEEAFDRPHVLRVPAHLFSEPPLVGQSIRLEFLVGQVISVRSDPG